MIKGFEDITHELTDDERKLLQAFVNGLKSKRGKQNAVSNKTIRQKFEDNWKMKIPDARVRKLINHIRINDLVPLLCSTSKGYFVAQSNEEVNDYLTGLKQRISAQQAVHDAIEKQYKKLTTR